MITLVTKELSLPYLSNQRSRSIIDSYESNTTPIKQELDILIEMNRLKHSLNVETDIIDFIKNFDSKYGFTDQSIPLELQFIILAFYENLPSTIKQKAKQESKMQKIKSISDNLCYSMVESGFYTKQTIPNSETKAITNSFYNNENKVDSIQIENNTVLTYQCNNIYRTQFLNESNTQTIGSPVINTQHGKKWMKDVLFQKRINEINDVYRTNYVKFNKLNYEQEEFQFKYNPYSISQNSTSTPINEVTEKTVRVTQLGKKLMTFEEKKSKL